MTPPDPPVPVAVMHMALQMGAALGLRRAELLAEIDIQEADLANLDGYVPLSKQVRLGTLIGEERPGVNIGLVSLDYVRVSILGVLGYVVSHCVTLGDALEAFARYQNVLSPAVRWDVHLESPPRIRIDAAPPLQALRFPLETQVGMWIVIGRQLTETQWAPQRVQLCHQPAGPPEEFEERYGCPVDFGAPVNELTLSEDVLALPVVGARPELQPSLVQLVQTVLQGLAPPEDHTSRMRALLLEELPRGMTTKDEAARRMGVSPRTLTRRLQQEGVSFRELLEDVRQQLARAWLTDPSVAIHEVAYLLGYSEPSTFHRSFRRWTGQTPAVWRREAGASAVG